MISRSFRIGSILLFAALAPLGVQAQDQDVIRITAGAGFERHSNLFRASPLLGTTDFTTAFGKSSRSDTILRGTLGIAFDREFSLQRFRAGVTLLPQKFQNYTRFDHLGYDGALSWDWEFAGPFSGVAGIRVNNSLMGFNQILVRSGSVTTQVDKNMLNRVNPYLTGRLRITPSWSIVGGIDQVRVTNSATAYLPGNFTTNGTEVGLRFAPGTGTELEFMARSTRGKYDYLQVTDFLGQNLGTPVDNSFKESEVFARLRVRPSEDSLIGGRLGFLNRKYDQFSQRDFSGPTAELNVNWRPGGGFFMDTSLDRSIALPGVFTANYIDITRLRIQPRVVLTGKVSMTGALEYSTWDYKGDSLVAATTTRKDTLTLLQVGLAYEFSRAITFNADVRQERRTSNIVGADFTNNVLIGGVTGRF